MKKIQLLFLSMLLALPMPVAAQALPVGDVNGDGTVNITDINIIINIILNGGNSTVADVNGDGTVNIADINGVISVILGGSNMSPLSPIEQKEYLETVALELMDKMPASDWDDITDLLKYIVETYGEDYNWDNVGQWAEDIFDALRVSLGTQTTETETYQWDEYTYKYNYIYTNYTSLLMASNFTGHFTARNGGWTLEEADDLQFIFTDKRGKQCVLKLETSGKTVKVYAFNMDDWTDYDSHWQGNTYIGNEYYDRTQCTIGVPEKVIVTLTQGGTQVIKSTTSIDLSSLSGEEFDISKSALSASTVTELNNGYKFDVSQAAYKGNGNTAISFKMSKGGTALVSMGAAANVNNLPSVNVSAFSSEDYDDDDYNWDNTSGKVTYAKLDILGKVQFQGSMTDVRKYVDYLDMADDNETNESLFKSYINQANALTDINLFYDGKNVKQAAIKLEPFVDETWNGRTYWTAEPIIYFFDGSSYSTFEAFFNEKDFKKTIDTFKNLANKYADLFDESIDW